MTQSCVTKNRSDNLYTILVGDLVNARSSSGKDLYTLALSGFVKVVATPVSHIVTHISRFECQL